MRNKVRVTIELLDPDTEEVVASVSAIQPARLTGVYPEGWPAICTAAEAFEAATVEASSDERWRT